MIKGIKHIIFDLGGVLLNIDYKLTEQAFVDLGITDFPKLYSQLHQTGLFDDWETGRINGDEFLSGLQKAGGMNIAEQDIINAWNAMLLDFPLRRLQILQQLRLHYDLILLSNTNEWHEAEFNRILYSTRGIPNIGVFFDKVYLSHRVGMRKPSKEIFDRVLSDNSFQAEHTLFLDDTPQHIEGAKLSGIQTIYMENGMTIEKDIFLPK